MHSEITLLVPIFLFTVGNKFISSEQLMSNKVVDADMYIYIYMSLLRP